MEELTIKQIKLIKENIDLMIKMICKADKNSVKFYRLLNIISNNINIFFQNDCDNLQELVKYIYEDWREICVGENGIENWRFDIGEINKKADYNRKFESVALSIDKILKTNYIIPKKWYYIEDLKKVGEGLNNAYWDAYINELKQTNRFCESKLKLVPNDIWSYAANTVSDLADVLIEWFKSDIPAFGYLSPLSILELKNGDDILRSFMISLPQ